MKVWSRFHSRAHRWGFTLIELLVASVITALLIGLTASIFSGGMKLWRGSAHRVDTSREARAALHGMERDLRTAVKGESALGGAAAGVAPGGHSQQVLPAMLFAHHPSTPVADRVNEELYFLTLLPQAGRGNLCAVGYRAVWDANVRCYILKCRLFKSEVVQTLLDELGRPEDDGTPLYFRPGGQEEEMARYIWDLSFRPCVEGEPASTYLQGSISPPPWVEIRFKAVGAKAVEKLKVLPVTRETWLNPSDAIYQKAILPYQQQFVIRARIYVSGK